MKRLLLCIALLCSVSCASVNPVTEKPPQPMAAPPDVPSPVVAQVEKDRRTDVAGPKELFSFTLREADVKDILRAIAKQTRYNIVIEPDVRGFCTVDLKNVTLPKALEYILEPLNLSFKIDEHTIFVSNPKLETKIFYLNYLNMKRVGSGNVTGTTGGGITSGGSTGAGGSSSGGSSGGTTGGGATAVTMTSDSTADIWKNLEDGLKNILSKDAKYFINKQAMMLYVTDYPKYIKSIAMLLEATEEIMHRQIMIEAKVIEVTLNDANRDGINWNINDGRILGYAVNAAQSYIPTLSAQRSLLEPGYGGWFSIKGKHLTIDNTFIEFLRKQGTVNIVSNPRVATLNNQRAVIKVARQDVYFEIQQQQGGGSSNNTTTATAKFLTVGLILDVLPQIDNDGNILMYIHPMMTEKVGSVPYPITNTDNSSGNDKIGGQGASVPILDVREADTLVRVRDGETVVIGGLIKEMKKTGRQSLKGLGSIPILGKLFRFDEEDIQKTELVIMLTPRIIYAKGVQ